MLLDGTALVWSLCGADIAENVDGILATLSTHHLSRMLTA